MYKTTVKHYCTNSELTVNMLVTNKLYKNVAILCSKGLPVTIVRHQFLRFFVKGPARNLCLKNSSFTNNSLGDVPVPLK